MTTQTTLEYCSKFTKKRIKTTLKYYQRSKVLLMIWTIWTSYPPFDPPRSPYGVARIFKTNLKYHQRSKVLLKVLEQRLEVNWKVFRCHICQKILKFAQITHFWPPAEIPCGCENFKNLLKVSPEVQGIAQSSWTVFKSELKDQNSFFLQKKCILTILTPVFCIKLSIPTPGRLKICNCCIIS